MSAGRPRATPADRQGGDDASSDLCEDAPFGRRRRALEGGQLEEGRAVVDGREAKEHRLRLRRGCPLVPAAAWCPARAQELARPVSQKNVTELGIQPHAQPSLSHKNPEWETVPRTKS